MTALSADPHAYAALRAVSRLLQLARQAAVADGCTAMAAVLADAEPLPAAALDPERFRRELAAVVARHPRFAPALALFDRQEAALTEPADDE